MLCWACRDNGFACDHDYKQCVLSKHLKKAQVQGPTPSVHESKVTQKSSSFGEALAVALRDDLVW